MAGPAAAQEEVGPSPVVPYTVSNAAEIAHSLTGEPADPARGAALFSEAGCTRCHAADPLPGAGLPPGALRLWIVAPAVIAPGTAMPAYYAAGQRRGTADPLHGGPRLTASQVEDLVAFLAAGGPH